MTIELKELSAEDYVMGLIPGSSDVPIEDKKLTDHTHEMLRKLMHGELGDQVWYRAILRDTDGKRRVLESPLSTKKEALTRILNAVTESVIQKLTSLNEPPPLQS